MLPQVKLSTCRTSRTQTRGPPSCLQVHNDSYKGLAKTEGIERNQDELGCVDAPLESRTCTWQAESMADTVLPPPLCR